MDAYQNTNGEPLIAPPEQLNFFHHAHAIVPQGMTAFQAYCRMTENSPRLLRLAFAIRDRLSRLGGVKPISGFTGTHRLSPPEPGEQLDFFEVVHCYDSSLHLLAKDRHLSVLVAVTLQAADGDCQRLSIITSVKTHNAFGRLYMLPVAPAHGVIVRSMLAKIGTSVVS